MSYPCLVSPRHIWHIFTGNFDSKFTSCTCTLPHPSPPYPTTTTGGSSKNCKNWAVILTINSLLSEFDNLHKIPKIRKYSPEMSVSAVLGQHLCVTRRIVGAGSMGSCSLQLEWSVLEPAQVRQVRQEHPPGRSQSRHLHNLSHHVSLLDG